MPPLLEADSTSSAAPNSKLEQEAGDFRARNLEAKENSPLAEALGRCPATPGDGESGTNTTDGAMDSSGQLQGSKPADSTIRTDSEHCIKENTSEPISEQPNTASAVPIERLSLSSKRSADTSALRLDTNAELIPPPPPEKDSVYIDPTPKTPQASSSPLPNLINKDLPDVPQDLQKKDGLSGKGKEGEGRKSEDSQSEIQSIMGQFGDETTSLRQEEIMSPRLELAAHPPFPPRKSSLESMVSTESPKDKQPGHWQPRRASILSVTNRQSLSPPAVPPKSPPSASKSEQIDSTGPPLPEPEPDQPFDFHRFLEQLRHRAADPVAKFLRSFLTEFGKRQWMVHEQVKIISDFLAFITNKMAICDVWKDVSDVEFDNAKEGMEKLVMNRLYSQTFSPAIPPPPALPRNRSRGRKKDLDKLMPGRRGQHQEDVERDEILAQKIRIYGWVREEHLDIPAVGSNGHRFLHLAQQELLKIKGYRAPRDKVICILNCCKVIFGLLKNAKNSDTSADSFMPLLIYVVLQANPEHLVSNLQYILRFRNQEKLGGEAGYYLSSLSGAIQFIETLDQTSLTVSQEEFDRNVEEAVSAIAEKNKAAETLLTPEVEKFPVSRELTPRNSEEQGSRSTGPPYSPGAEENPSMVGILRTIQKPLTTIGRMFSEESEPSPQQQQQRIAASSQQTQGALSAVYPPRTSSSTGRNRIERQPVQDEASKEGRNVFEAQEAAARQASAEAAEADRIQQAEHADVVETLSGMFPNLDRDIIDDVVRMKEGRVGLAVDACLALSAE